MSGHGASSLSLLAHPYQRLEPFTGGRAELKEAARRRGSAIVWLMGKATDPPELKLLSNRPGGLSLLTVLPKSPDILGNPALVQAIQRLRPNGILPHHEEPRASELAHVLRRPPLDLAVEVTDYLEWRGLRFDHDTVRLIRRIVELSENLRSVTGLARNMYMSRRALGRRFMTLGLPVPSHWLQMARLLRVVIRLQNTDDSVFAVACGQGYPDGFSVSNQMYRLFGCRPTEVRERLGWEWVFEEWLRREAEAGAFAPTNADKFSGVPLRGTTPPALRRHARARRRDPLRA